MRSIGNRLQRLCGLHRPSCIARRTLQPEIETLENREVLTSGTGLFAQYYSDQTLTNLVTSKVDPTVNFNWNNQSPAQGVPASNYSVRWTGQFEATATGPTNIYTHSVGGIRVYINGKLVINNWSLHSLHEDEVQLNLVAGQKYSIEVDFHQGSGQGLVQLFWSSASTKWQVIPMADLFPASTPPATSSKGLLGQYYSDQTLTNLVTSRVDPTVNFNWNNQSPAPGVPTTGYSVRWTGQFQAEFTEATNIYTHSVGGIRVYINGKLVINDWNLHALKEDEIQLSLVAGKKYSIEIDFHQGTGQGLVQLFWSSASMKWQVIPTTQLSSSSSAPSGGSSPPPPPPTTTTSNWFTQNLHDPGIISLATTLDTDNVLSRNDMLAIFQEVESKGAITSTELTDLQTLVSNAGVLNMPGYLENLADKVVYGDPANATYQGQALGNLAVGSSATQLQDLVGKWFLGTDLPVLTTNSVKYTSVAGTLFGSGGPKPADVVQGQVNDCYFVAALAGIAANSPQSIVNDFIDNGDGTFTVRFYNNGVSDYVTVNRFLPTTSNGQLWYAGMGASVSNSSNVLWVPLLEKAYAQLSQEGWARPTAANAYSALNDGWEGTIVSQVTGKGASFTTIDSSSTTLNAIVNTFQSGKMVFFNSDASTTSSVIAGHDYAMIGYTAATKTFTLYNPWGSQIQLSWSQVAANFDWYTYSL